MLVSEKKKPNLPGDEVGKSLNTRLVCRILKTVYYMYNDEYGVL